MTPEHALPIMTNRSFGQLSLMTIGFVANKNSITKYHRPHLFFILFTQFSACHPFVRFWRYCVANPWQSEQPQLLSRLTMKPVESISTSLQGTLRCGCQTSSSHLKQRPRPFYQPCLLQPIHPLNPLPVSIAGRQW